MMKPIQIRRVQEFISHFYPDALKSVPELNPNTWLQLASTKKPLVSTVQTNTPVWLESIQLQDSVTKILDYLESVDKTYMATQTRKANADDILKVFKKGYKWPLYPQLTNNVKMGVTSLLFDFMQEQRESESEFVHTASRTIFDKPGTTLNLFSPAGVYSPWHVDWSEAFNVAFGIQVRLLSPCPSFPLCQNVQEIW